MYELKSVSSLNLRKGRNIEERTLVEPIKYKCSICKNNKLLGKDSFVLVKISYLLNGVTTNVKLCGKCVDVFSDMFRYGPRVIDEAYKWLLNSRVARMSLVGKEMYCFNCLGTETSHLFIKYDDLNEPGKSGHYNTKRVCSRCAISYLKMMSNINFKSCSFDVRKTDLRYDEFVTHKFSSEVSK